MIRPLCYIIKESVIQNHLFDTCILIIHLRQFIFMRLNAFTYDIDWLVQERRNSIANALGLRLSCINP